MIKKILSFMSLFVLTFCFISGCKNDDDKEAVLVDGDGKEVIATINGVNYTADLSYEDLVTSNDTVGYLYEELEDLLIKSVVTVTDSMRNRANNYVEKLKKEAKENATINGTSYKDALKASLEGEGVSSEEELIEKKIFEYQEEIVTNQYWNDNKDRYYDEYLNNGYVYHVSQILVSVGTNGNLDKFNVEITSSVAEKLYDVASSLMNGESFYNVALRYSDDTASKENGGDLGLVTLNDTDIPEEVKYALANYSIYFEDALLENPEYLDTVYGNGIETITQEYVDLLGTVYDDGSTNYITTGISGTVSLTSRVYGRNIIFNNLFNSRTFRFLQSEGDKNIKSMDNILMPLADSVGFDAKSAQNIVVNSDGNPILVVRSDKGIHFISINKSAFAGEEELIKYYSKEVNYTDDYRTYLEKAVNNSDQETRLAELESFSKNYVNMIITGNSNYASNNVDFVRFDMFKNYLNGTYGEIDFEIKDEKIKEVILRYIDRTMQYRKDRIEKVFNEGFEYHSNKVQSTDSSIFQKEIPLLNCLNKDSNGKYMCTYSYKEGFKSYTSVTAGGEVSWEN